jgi:type II secretory pathway component GspD/PulD (secretin)
VVAGTADERETYLAALRKFCLAAIAPRLPGVSCMATANLKERIDHMLRLPSLKSRMLPTAGITLTAAAALVMFTAGAAILASGDAFARGTQEGDKPFSLRLGATKDTAGIMTLYIAVRDNATHQILATPRVKLDATRSASTRTTVDDYVIDADVRPADNGRSNLTVTITKNGQEIQKTQMFVLPRADNPSRVYTGAKISMDLQDADVRDVLNTFGKLTGLKMQIDPDVQGKVTVHWHDVPWDEAFDDLVNEHDLMWTIQGDVAHIFRK